MLLIYPGTKHFIFGNIYMKKVKNNEIVDYFKMSFIVNLFIVTRIIGNFRLLTLKEKL